MLRLVASVGLGEVLMELTLIALRRRADRLPTGGPVAGGVGDDWFTSIETGWKCCWAFELRLPAGNCETEHIEADFDFE